MADEIKIIAKIVTDDRQAKVKAQQTGKQIATKVDQGAKGAKFGDVLNSQFDKVKNNTFADNIKGKLQDVKKGIQAVGVSGDKLSKIGDFFKGGIISAFAAAALLAGQALKKMWDDAHESAEQYYQRMKKNQQVLDDAINKSQQESRATNEWFNRLHQINNLQKISNAQKAQASMLIGALTRQYGQLGITVDGTTGKYQNLYEAQLKVLDLQYEAQLRLRQQKRDSYLGRGGTAHVSAVQVMRLLGDETSYNQTGYVTDQGVVNTEAYGGNFKRALNMGLDVKLNTNSRRRTTVVNGVTRYYYLPLDEKDAEYNRKWNQGGYDGKLWWVDYMIQKHAGNQQVQNALRLLQRQILDAKIASAQYSAYRDSGKPSEQKALQDVTANNRRIQQQRDRGEDIENQNSNRRRIQQQQAEYQALDTQEKIDWQTRKNNEAKAEITRATAEVTRLQAEYQQSDKDLAQTIKSGDTAKIQIAQRQHLELLQRLNAERQKLQDARNTQQSSRLELQRLREQLRRQQQQQRSGGRSVDNSKPLPPTTNKRPLITAEIKQAEKDLAELQTKTDAESVRQQEQLRRRIAEYYSSVLGRSGFEAQYRQLLADGKKTQAERLKVIYQLRSSGVKFDESTVNEILANRAKLQELVQAQRLADAKVREQAEKQRQQQQAERRKPLTAQTIQGAEQKLATLEGKQDLESLEQAQFLRGKIAQYYSSEQQKLAFQIRQQQLINRGLTQQAKREKIIYDLKVKGLAFTEQDVNNLMQQQNYLQLIQQQYRQQQEAKRKAEEQRQRQQQQLERQRQADRNRPLTEQTIKEAEQKLASIQNNTDYKSIEQAELLRRKIAQYYSSERQQLAFQIRQQQLINQGLTQQAKKEQIIYKLKVAGKSFNDADVTALMQNQAKLDKLRAEYQAQKNRQQAEKQRQQQQAERQRQSENYYTQRKQQLSQQLTIQRLLLQGRFRQAEELKVLLDVKRQGLKIDNKEIENIAKLNQRLTNLQKRKGLVEMGTELASQYGTSQQRLIQEYKELTQGISNKGLKADYWRLLKLRQGSNNLPSVQQYQMQATQLTRRGGFKTGYIDNADRINRQIANNTKLTNDYLQQIKQINQRNGRF